MSVLQADALRAQLRDYIQGSLLDGEPVAYDEDLLLSGLLDSLSVMSLVAFAEKASGIKIPFEDVLLENFETINAISSYLENRYADV